jgi:hypothetical protein
MLDGMRDHNIALIVAERGFWSDIPSIHQLHRLLAGEPFELLTSVALRDTALPGAAAFFDIFRREDYRREREEEIVIDLPLIGKRYTMPAGAM